MIVYVPGTGETDPAKVNMSLQQLGGCINGRHGADIPSAATINLETSTGDLVDVTGTTTITAITLNEGHEATVRFTGILTLTNSASLILPGGANITTAAGDFATFRGYASGIVRCVFYSRASGAALVAASTGRELLTAARTYYVRTDGSDSNTGLANTSGGAFLTIQKAVDVVAALDTSIYDVTINLGNGTYTGAVVLKSTTGAGKVMITGDTTTPSNVLVSVTGATAFTATTIRGRYRVEGIKVATITSGHAFYMKNSSLELGAINYGALPPGGIHVFCEAQSYVIMDTNYTISGGTTGQHWTVRSGSYLDVRSLTITLTGTPAIGIFCYADGIGNILAGSLTFVGTATGQRYNISGNSVVNTGGGGATYLPGNSAGAATTGGQYI